MNYSKLLSQIIEDADKIRSEYRVNFISAPVILIAVAQKCKKDYSGISEYDDIYHPEWFEEDRLRYAFKKVFKGTANITDIYLRNNLKKIYDVYDKDFMKDKESFFEEISKKREKKMISADLVLAEAINSLAPEHRPAVFPDYKDYFDTERLLLDTDKNVFSHIIAETEKSVSKLQAKAKKAAEIRDWKPAPKFTSPETLENMFFSSVKTTCKDKVMEIEIPFFFGDQGELSLELCYADGIYYVNDKGCAVKVLRENTTKEVFNKVMDRISKNLSKEGDVVIGCFSQVHTFLQYLQSLVFVAHGDLYYENLEEEGLCADPGISFIDKDKAELFPENSFVQDIKEKIHVDYDENSGLYIVIGMRYSLNSSPVSYLIETLDNEMIRISDRKKGNIEGEIFESFYFGHDDISAYSDYINKFCQRFGAEFDGKNIWLICRNEDVVKSLYSFINLAVLLSEFGRIH